MTIKANGTGISSIWILAIAALLPSVFSANAAPPSGFNEMIKPFLKENCVRCHGKKKQKAKLTLHDATVDFSKAETSEFWLEILAQLTARDMPPSDEEAQPTDPERNAVIEWIDRQLLTAGSGETYRKKLLAPEYGNWVNHEKLFSGEIKTPPFSPSRLWRFNTEIFAHKGFGKAKSPFSYVTSERGIRDYAALSIADQSTVQMTIIVADSFLADREKRGDFSDFSDDKPVPEEQALAEVIRREHSRVLGRYPSNEEQEKYLTFLKRSIKIGGKLEGVKTTIKAMFLSPESIYRMEFGMGEVDEYGRRHLSPEELAHAIAYALTDHRPDNHRLIREALQKDQLKTKGDVAQLTRKILNEQLLTGHWNRKDLPRIMRFFDEFFGFHRAGTVFKDNDRQRAEKINQWNTDMLIHDARMLIEHTLEKDKDVIAELLTTNEYFIAHPGDNNYAREHYEKKIAEIMNPGFVETRVELKRNQIKGDFNFKDMPEKAEEALVAARRDAEQTVAMYKAALENGLHRHPNFPFSKKGRGIADLLYIEPYNLPSNGRHDEQKWDWPIAQPLKMPKEERAGLLTHPAWLTAYSLNEDNDPIHRGIWIYERLLAGVLGDVPPDVDAAVPTDPHKTLRERMEPLRSERCWKCHRKMNPLGEAFEIFDDWGRYRTHHYFGENGEIYRRRDSQFDRKLKEGKLKRRKVDASGEITFPGDPKIDGKVKNAVEMMQRLGRSDRARQSFIRHLFRYFMGRNEMLSDSKTLIEAEEAYLNNSGSFKALVISLLSSDSFLYRR
ncbi:MAG: DUF1588 domain-containing protein [Verrucomicrobia bacterium]|jgi:hypothetical protein|nr:DUF1588 domain-containing protein [Verrucomicrobiota bacterium]MDB4785232.1 DUF1588 domain-containing protein [Akkermansiaceae bacterium]